MHDVWWEKYRPQKVEDMFLPSETASFFLRESFDLKKCANLLFLGDPGSGKTTLAKILAYQYDSLYINASDANGIDTIRVQIADFVKTASMTGDIKVIVLDEADGLSSVAGAGSSAQQALRNLIEENLDHCRFILTANYAHKLIDALQSRCQTFRFHVPPSDCARGILNIAKQEKVKIRKSDLSALVKRYAPDLRKCINEFQKGVNDDNVFVYVDDGSDLSIANKVVTILESKIAHQKVFDIREELIKLQQTFSSNWHGLMREMFQIYSTKRNLKACVIVAEHMHKDAIVMDKEVNFAACLFQLAEL